MLIITTVSPFTGPLVPLTGRVLPFINIEANNNNNNNSDLRSADFHHPLSPPEYSRNARRISLSKLLARILDEGNSQSRRVSIIGRASSARFFRDAFSRRGADRLSTPDRTWIDTLCRGSLLTADCSLNNNNNIWIVVVHISRARCTHPRTHARTRAPVRARTHPLATLALVAHPFARCAFLTRSRVLHARTHGRAVRVAIEDLSPC